MPAFASGVGCYLKAVSFAMKIRRLDQRFCLERFRCDYETGMVFQGECIIELTGENLGTGQGIASKAVR